MINFLQGKIIAKTPTEVTLLAGDVGYQVIVSTRTAKTYSLNQKNASIHIYTHVRDDTLKLYGFIDVPSKDMFLLLLSVSGIGPKIALSVESTATGKQIASAIREAEVEFFTKIPGLGKKSAQRIIVDLKSKLGTIKELDLTDQDADKYAQVSDALKSLGFTAKETRDAINNVKNKDKLSDSDIIKQALRILGK